LDTPAPPDKQKRPDVEAFRTIAAAMIVWYHAGAEGQEIAYGGLIVFLIISTYLAALARDRDMRSSLKTKLHRLIVPWAFWMVVYGLVNLVLGKPLAPESSNWVAKLLAGTATHLWYMPFIFMTLLLTDVLKNNLRSAWLGAGGGIAAAALLFTISAWRDVSIAMGYPVAQYCHAAAGAMIGLLFGFRSRMPKSLFLGLFALVIAAAICALPWRGVGATYLVGILFGATLSFEWLRGAHFLGLERLAPYTLGIYFVHVLVLWGVTKLRLPNVAEFIITLGLSAALVIGLSRQFPRWVRYWA
jgi:fucose 4-O-acetylase-like acetyltransferase